MCSGDRQKRLTPGQPLTFGSPPPGTLAMRAFYGALTLLRPLKIQSAATGLRKKHLLLKSAEFKTF